MIYKPHNYQKYAIEFIKEHPVAAILLDVFKNKRAAKVKLDKKKNKK